ncbi:helix-turn-helix transcriptional regulator [Burkholderia gladioli]|uniref:helix-turn-helix transcriptional regulator n=1 Tax=Burkholderia gladioli TaxID=28095 RepID=UPI001640B979|nr:AlpA family phage regulatory protein [Burkholderia gladioli]
MPRKRQKQGLPINASKVAKNQQLLRLADVSTRTHLSKSEIYRRIKLGTFPCNIKIGSRAVAWRESDIDNWIKSLS